MAETKSLEQIHQEIATLYNRFFMLDSEIVGYLEKSISAGWTAWSDSWSPMISDRLNSMVSILGFTGLRKQDLKDYVDNKLYKFLWDEQKRLSDKQQEIADSWAENRNARLISVAVNYYSDTPGGKQIYVAAQDYLRKLKESDERIRNAENVISRVEFIRKDIPPTSDFWIAYNELIKQVDEAKKIRAMIPLKPDAVMYQTFGLGIVWEKVIIWLGAILATATLIYLLWDRTLIFGDKQIDKAANGIKDELNKRDIKNERIDAVADSQINAVLSDTSLSPEQKKELINTINGKRNEEKKKNDDQAQSIIDKIIKVIKDWGTYALVGTGIVIGGIVLIAILPSIWPKKKEIQYVQATPGIVQQ